METDIKKYSLILLDVDGTLVDSNDIHAKAWQEALSNCGYSVPFKKIRKLIGMGGDKLLPTVTGVNSDSREGKRITKARSRVFLDRYVSKIKPLARAHELLRKLKKEGYKLVTVSSSEDKELKEILKRGHLVDMVEIGEKGHRSKPDPDILHKALKQFGKSPPRALMLGDTPYDVMAARKAKVDIYAFRSGGWSDHSLRQAKAIFDGPADFLEQIKPLF